MLFKCTIYNITRFDFEIYIDGTKIDDFQYISNKIHINCTLDKGLHHLKIVNNKENNISKSLTKKLNIIYINKCIYDLKFEINKDFSLDLTCVYKKIELEKNHIHWRAFSCNSSNAKIINESFDFGELCKIIAKYGNKILLKDLGFITAFASIGIYIISTILHRFSKYDIVMLIYFVVAFGGFGLYYLSKWLIKCYRYYAIIKKIKANESNVSVDLLDWFIYDGKWGLRD